MLEWTYNNCWDRLKGMTHVGIKPITFVLLALWSNVGVQF